MDREKLSRLVQHAQRGNQNAVSILFELFRNEVYSIALRETKNQALADDIVQETFIEVILTIDDLKDPSAFPSWLKQIAYHQCTRHFKKKETKHEFQIADSDDALSVLDTLEEKNSTYIPDEALDQKEFRAAILNLIDELPETQGSALRMFYFDELPLKSIAEVQGVSVNTANTRLNRGRKAMKNNIESYEKKHGIRLHTIAFFPFFKWLFADTKYTMPMESIGKVTRNIATETGIRISITQADVPTTGRSISPASTAMGEGLTGGSSTASIGTASFSAKIAATPIAAKIAAGILAVTVAVGGVAGYQVSLNNSSNEQQPSSASEIEATLEENVLNASNSPDTTIPNPEPITTMPSFEQVGSLDTVYEVYESMLREGTTMQGFVPAYYAYVDIDQNGIPELLMADNDGLPSSWTTCEMYTCQDGEVIYCGYTDARYTHFYHVNEKYLLGTNRMGAWYVSPGDTFRTVYQTEAEIIRNDESRESVTKEEFDFYNAFTIDENGFLSTGGFVEKSKILQLQPNHLLEGNILEQTLDFSKAWSIVDRQSEYILIFSYAFESDGSAYCIIDVNREGWVDLCKGSYTTLGNMITFTMETQNGTRQYSYTFDPQTLQFTQMTDDTLFGTYPAGSTFKLENDEWYTANEIKATVINNS